MRNLSFLPIWRKLIYTQLFQGNVPKTLIVNREDFNDYEDELAKLYPGGIIPAIEGYIRYKNIPLGIADSLGRNECALELKENKGEKV